MTRPAASGALATGALAAGPTARQERERIRGTLLGLGAVGLWATLAPLSTLARGVPPLQQVALTFTLATLLGLGHRAWARLGQPPVPPQPPRLWWRAVALGTAGLFIFHVCWFIGFAHAPAVQVTLIGSSWPLIMVVLSGLLPGLGERLRWSQALGTVIGFGGVVLIVQARGDAAMVVPDGGIVALGVAAAAGAAVTWSSYSVANRRFRDVPVTVVTLQCALVAVLAALAHLGVEGWVWPDARQALGLLALGLGPVGAAFFLWDLATKRGSLPVLAAAAYLNPLIATVLLIAAGEVQARLSVLAAALLVVTGAMMGGWPMLAPLLRGHRQPDPVAAPPER